MKNPIDFKDWFAKTQKLSPVNLDFQHSRFLSPSFDLNSLISKKSYNLFRLLSSIKNDVKAQLLASPTLNKHLRENIYQLYIDYCSLNSLEFDFNESSYFWKQLHLDQNNDKISLFIDDYSFKISFLFLMKQTFLCRYAKQKSINVFEAYYANLNTFFSKLFPHGSSKQIDIMSSQLNEFTWYQPNLFLAPQLKKMATSSQDCLLNDFIEAYQLFKKCHKSSWRESLYSAAISAYRSFNREHASENFQTFKIDAPVDISFLEYIYKHFPKKFIQVQDNYHNIISELFFLISSLRTPEHIDHALKLFYGPKINSIFQDQVIKRSTKVDAYFIESAVSIKEILNNVDELANATPIFILSKKPLFSPSSREKSINLLSSLTPIAHLNYSQLINGQALSHIYLCQKISSKQKQSSHFHLRYGGEFNRDHDFKKLNKLTNDFFNKTKNKYPMAYSARSQDSSFFFDFFQDAVIDGLLMSASQGSKQLTHPNFFYGITSNCVPLESLFKTSPLTNDSGRDQSPLLGSMRSLPEYVLTIESGFSQNFQTIIDIIPGESYLGHLKEHGQVDNQYFALIPKHPDLNIALLRTFLRSTIGRQITELCFAGNFHYRTKLKTLLVPRFIGSLERVPENVMKGLQFLSEDVEELKKSPPQILYANLKKNQLMLEELFEKYPLTILSQLSRFRNKLAELVANIDVNNSQHINFYQPQLITELQNLRTAPILPRHEDVYIDFHVASNQLDEIVTSFKITQQEDELYIIDLLNQDRKLASLHTKKYLSLFLEFLLKQMQGFPLERILKSLNLPVEEQLAATLPSYSVDYSVINELGLKCETLVEQLLRRFIINQ